MTDVQFALLVLGHMPGVDGEVRHQLADRLLRSEPDTETLQALLQGRPGDLEAVPGRSKAALERAAETVLREAESTVLRCRAAGITMVFRGSDPYPRLPALMTDAPPLLYVRGHTELLTADLQFAALVGSRRASRQGLAFTRRSAAELADNGFVIVSGMALGIDAAAHQGALDVEGRTIAVLASSVDELTPRSNEQLGKRILEYGAVVSERPPGTEVGPWSFPERNRIIAALAPHTIILEAGVGSGSEHTALRAREYGHTLYVMPGRPGDPLTAGGLQLLKVAGTRLFTGAHDLINSDTFQSRLPLGLDPELLKLAQLLREHLPCRLDVLPERLGLRERVPVLLGSINLLKLHGILHEDASGHLNLIAQLPGPGPGPVDST